MVNHPVQYRYILFVLSSESPTGFYFGFIAAAAAAAAKRLLYSKLSDLKHCANCVTYYTLYDIRNKGRPDVRLKKHRANLTILPLTVTDKQRICIMYIYIYIILHVLLLLLLLLPNTDYIRTHIHTYIYT